MRKTHHLAGEPFYLYRRKKIFYVKPIDPVTGLVGTGKSTGKTTEAEARATAWEWHYKGVPGKTKRSSANLQSALQYIAAMPADDAVGARQIIEKLQKRGFVNIPVVSTDAGRHNFIDFLLEFHDYEKSEYVRGKHRHNHSIGEAHCYDQTRWVKLYWQKRFAGRTIESITSGDLDSFALDLSRANIAAR
ncbi:hypothetical protein FACS1894107_14770 [Planctomycetales bacterium]|nr:hypothetical protein FACS1894107_14770 [Planctomycetales bacterium]GHS98560.1 hypothetical protein FACS1894108_06930 [Planctomycetales bacterium]